MDQSHTDLLRMTSMLRGSNMTAAEGMGGGGGRYNFSDAVAYEVMREFVSASMYTVRSPPTIALIVLYVPVFVLSLLGNALVVVVLLRSAHMRRTKNVFLVNVAATDLLVTVLCIPMLLAQIIVRLWLYGRVLCKLTGYVQGVGAVSGILSLVALSVDRYLALRAPPADHRGRRHTHVSRVLGGIWLAAALLVSPLLYVRRVYVLHFARLNLSLAYCVELWPRAGEREIYGVFLLIATYVLPIAVMAACYTMIGRSLCSPQLHRTGLDRPSAGLQGRKRVARMLAAVISMFIVSWLPYNILSLYIDVHQHYVATQLLPFSLWFAHSHSAVNPFLFWFLNPSFRHCMRKMLRGRGTTKRPQSSPCVPQPAQEHCL